MKCNRIAHTRDWTVQRDLQHEKFRNSVLVFPLKVTAKIDEWQKLTYEPGGGNCTVISRRAAQVTTNELGGVVYLVQYGPGSVLNDRV